MTVETSSDDHPRWWTAIPFTIASRLDGAAVVGVSFAAGPSFVAGLSHRFTPAADWDAARTWLQPYEESLRRCAIEFADGTLLYFERGGTFLSCRDVKANGSPTPGVTVTHSQP